MVEPAEPIVLVDGAIRELRIRPSLVPSRLVDGGGEAAPFDLDAEEAVDIGVEPDAERRTNSDAIAAIRLAAEIASVDVSGGLTIGCPHIGALLNSKEDDTGLDIEIRIDEELLEEGELTAEGDEVDLRPRRPSDLPELLREIRAAREREAVGARGRTELLDLARKLRREADAAIASPKPDAEPIEEVIVELSTDHQVSLEGIPKGDADMGDKHHAVLSVDPHMVNSGRASEGARDLDLLGARVSGPGERGDRDEAEAQKRGSESIMRRRHALHLSNHHLGFRYSNLKGKKTVRPIDIVRLL